MIMYFYLCVIYTGKLVVVENFIRALFLLISYIAIGTKCRV